jgi:hypothetical protein
MLLKRLLKLQAENPSKPMELAKLTKELLTHAEKHKVQELKYEENSAKRRNAYHNWIARVGPILGMFPETCEVLQNDAIIPYLDPSCHGNQALFLLISAKVDAYFRALIRRHKGFGDRALELIKTQCANVTNVDKHHFHKAFTSLAILHEESATHFLQRFTIGRQQAEFANNIYSKAEIVDYCIAGLQGSTKTHYMLAVQMFQAKINSNTPVTLREIEKWFNGLDEMLARATRAPAKGRSAQQRRLPARSNNSNTSQAHSATASETSAHDFSNYMCYNCNEKGHIASACPKPRRNKSNNTNNNGSSARRSKNNNDRKAQGAKRGMARSRSVTANTTSSTDGSVEHACMARVVHA